MLPLYHFSVRYRVNVHLLYEYILQVSGVNYLEECVDFSTYASLKVMANHIMIFIDL